MYYIDFVFIHILLYYFVLLQFKEVADKKVTIVLCDCFTNVT